MQLIPTSKESLIDFLKDLPKEPGIYKFLDEKKIPLLVTASKSIKDFGSAKKLQNPFKRTLSRLYELTSGRSKL